MSLSASIVEYVSECRIPQSAIETATDLETLGKHGADWPRATATHWMREIRELIDRGELREVDGLVMLPIVVDESPKQMSLFD